ncbi:MAG: hypothetical protein ACI3WS_05410 [Phascolarctobacterium sp.]
MNTSYIGHYNIAMKGTTAVIMAYETGADKAFTIGAYDGMQEAQKALKDLFVSLKENKDYHCMPLSRLDAEQPIIKDGRIKRHGGS